MALTMNLTNVQREAPTFKTETGEIVTLTDAKGEQYFREMKAEIIPVQSGSGDPSPDNVRPISGFSEVKVTRTGKNLFDKSKAVIGKFINISLQEIENGAKSHSELIPVKPSTAYFMNGFGNSGYFAILAVDANKQPITWYGGASKDAPFTATTPSNCHYVYLNFNTDQIDTMAFYEGNTNEGYIPYQGNAYTIQLGETVYGGTLDVRRGKVRVTKAVATIDGTSIKVEGIYANGTAYTNNVPDIEGDPQYIHQRDARVQCDKLKSSSFVNISNVPYGIAQSGGYRLVLNIPNLSTVSEFNTWLASNPLSVLYILAEPFEVSVAPEAIKTLVGENNVWTDTGEVTVTYKVDPDAEPTFTLASPLGANLGGFSPSNSEGEEIITELEDPENGANLTTESEVQNSETEME